MSVTAKTLMNDWYGYDKKIEKPELISGYSLGITDSYSDYTINPIPARKISYLRNRGDKIKAVIAYVPPCDGFTDEDFIAWLESPDFYNKEGYRLGVLRGQVSRDLWGVQSLLAEFFRCENSRSDRIFRTIELHEFMLRAGNDQTFENFLLTDTEYIEACNNLHFTETEVLKKIIDSRLPAFLKFERKTTLKTKRLLLSLTKSEIETVYDFSNNPLHGMNRENNHTYEYAEQFIKAALGEHSKLDITEMSMSEIIEAVMIAAMRNDTAYWMNQKGRVKKKMETLIEYLGNVKRSVSLTRNLAYVISVGGLNGLDPTEIMAVVCAFESPGRWANATAIGANETICEVIHAKKVDPVHMSRIISHVIMNESAPLDLKDDFDWSSINDVPVDWAVSLLAGNRKSSMVKIVALKTMMS